MAHAHFDGKLNLKVVQHKLVKIGAADDLILQVPYDVLDKPGHEHWRIVFRAGLGSVGATRGPAIFDLTDRRSHIDSERGVLEQRLTLPAGTHDVAFTVEAYYSAVPWDDAILDETKQDARIDGTITVSV